jgi:hypothetical protein
MGLALKEEAMRRLLIALVAFATPQTAFAAPASNTPISDSLPSRDTIERAGTAVERMLRALMQIDIAPLADAVDPGRPRAGRRETIGDLARRDDPYFDERLQRSVGAFSDTMIALQDTVRRLEPALRQSMREFERSVEEATRDLPRDTGR